ncbi:DNA recombination protein RmuC [Hydrocarboniphaga sp.]|uniref:DNA recombination protein RmuC n=1 Tax=Hydrocarboniphaga sp. TaxID=2033016 RepID=UPI003D0E3816
MTLTLIVCLLAVVAAAALTALLVRAQARTQIAVAQTRSEHLSTQLAELQSRLQSREADNATLQRSGSEQQSRIAELQIQLHEERRQNQERLASFEEAKHKLEESFKALSADALQASQEAFMRLAGATFEKLQAQTDGKLEQREQAVKALVEPIGKSLEGVRSKIDELEKSRAEAYGSLSAQVRSMIVTQDQLRLEAGNLVKALRAPQTRGRWGEIQLKRVVEMAGMLDYCDFEQQVSVTTDDGRLRPDLIVRLPGGKRVIVDAKAPLQAYLDAVESTDDTLRQTHLAHHARQLRDHVNKLSAKNYWQQFDPTPEFVVMFLPGESFFSAALEQQPALIEDGVKQGVIVATPTTLIALLRAVSYGWRQETIAENAQAIAILGRDLYERIGKLAEHFGKLGKNLGTAVNTYNDAVGTLESRVLPQARRFKEFGAGNGDIATLDGLQQATRQLQAPELVLGNSTTQSAD